jgi:predicted dehydrogenase
MKPVGIALIGCGRVSEHHCRCIARVPEVRLAAVCDLLEERAIKFGQDFNVPHYTNYHQMLRERDDIDVVAIITPSGIHHEHALDVMQRYRKHLIVEKPTFIRPSQVVDAYRVADSLGVKIFPVFQNRHNTAVRRVKQALATGELGEVRILAVRVRWCRPQRYYDMSPWRGTFAQDGGSLTNQGIHHIDLAKYLGGTVREVSAAMVTLGAQIEVEDVAVGSFRFAHGGVGVLEVTTAARPHDFEASLSIVGSEGLAQIGGIAVNELQVFTPNPAECITATEDFNGNVYGHGHVMLYREIAAALNGGAPFSVSREDCLSTIKLLHSFYRADEAGGWTTVDVDDESVRLGRPDEALANRYRTPAPDGVTA